MPMQPYFKRFLIVIIVSTIFLPPVKSVPMRLRPGRHNYCELPVCKYTSFKRSLQGVCLLIMIKYTFIAFICFIF